MNNDPWSDVRSSSINDDIETVISTLSNNNTLNNNSNTFKLGSHRKNSINSDIQQPVMFTDENINKEPSSPIIRRTTLSLGGYSLQSGNSKANNNNNNNSMFANNNSNNNNNFNIQFNNHNSVNYPLNKISTFSSANNNNNNTNSLFADNRRGSYTLNNNNNNNISAHGSSILKNPNVNTNISNTNTSFFESFGKQLVEATKEIESSGNTITARSSFSEVESRSHSIKEAINSLNPQENYQPQQPFWNGNPQQQQQNQSGFVPGFHSMYSSGPIPPNFMMPPGMMMFGNANYMPQPMNPENFGFQSGEEAKEGESNKKIPNQSPTSPTLNKDIREQVFAKGMVKNGSVSPIQYPMATTPPVTGTSQYMPMSLMNSPISTPPMTSYYNNNNNTVNNNNNNNSGSAAKGNKKSGFAYNNNPINNGKKFNKMKRKEQVIRSERLEHFIKTYKDANYDLEFILGGSLEFCKDQVGSRFIQDVLPSTNETVLLQFYNEIDDNVLDLMMDVFGNYVIQKMLEFSNNENIIDRIMGHVEGNALVLTKSQYGCRIIQKALSYVPMAHKLTIVEELKQSSVIDCINDQNGNHVIQKAIENIPIEKLTFIIDQLQTLISKYATHPYGCRVIQRLLEFGDANTREIILTELSPHYSKLITNEFGNYVIQYILKSCNESTSDLLRSKQEIISLVYDKILEFSCHKYASNVVEQILILGDAEQQKKMFDTILPNDEASATNLSESELIYLMMRDQYANYVIQKMVKIVADGSLDQRKLILSIRCYLKKQQQQQQAANHTPGQKRTKNLASVDKLTALVNNIKL